MFEEIMDNIKTKSIDLVPEVKSKEKNISNQLKFYREKGRDKKYYQPREVKIGDKKFIIRSANFTKAQAKQLEDGFKALEKWKKDPTPSNWVKLFRTSAGTQTSFSRNIRSYLTGEKSTGGVPLTKNIKNIFDAMNVKNLIGEESKIIENYTSDYFKKIRPQLGATAGAAKSAKDVSAAIARTVGETFLLDPENTTIDDVAKALHGKKFDKASNIEKVKLLQDARNGVQKFYESLTINRPIGLKKKISVEQFQDILDNIESNSNDFGFQEGQIRDYKMKVRDDLLNVKNPEKFYRKLRNNIQVPKGKVIDEVFSLSGMYERAPGYLDKVQLIPEKINKMKRTKIDLPLQNILTAIDEGRENVIFNKKQVSLNEAVKQFNKQSKAFANVHKIQTPQINVGGKFNPNLYKEFSPASQRNILNVFKNKNYFLTTAGKKASSKILKAQGIGPIFVAELPLSTMAEGKPFVETLDPLTFGAVNPVTYAAKKQADLSTGEKLAMQRQRNLDLLRNRIGDTTRQEMLGSKDPEYRALGPGKPSYLDFLIQKMEQPDYVGSLTSGQQKIEDKAQELRQKVMTPEKVKEAKTRYESFQKALPIAPLVTNIIESAVAEEKFDPYQKTLDFLGGPKYQPDQFYKKGGIVALDEYKELRKKYGP